MTNPTDALSATEFTPEDIASLDTLLSNSHPLMVEAFYLAAIPKWYDINLLKTLRNKDDGREQGLVTRLNRYSFVSSLHLQSGDTRGYSVRAEERDLLQRRWIKEDPEAYKAAHQRALIFWGIHPDPNPFAHAQNCLYHQFFVDYAASVRDLIVLFRTYANDRQFTAIEHLLNVAKEAGTYVTLLDVELTAGIDDLLTYLKARLAQLRGQWAKSRDLLNGLEISSG